MNYLRINRLSEEDFDSIVEQAGGNRVIPDGSNFKGLSADYVLNEAILELKLVREEGLLKESRRKKIAEIFRASQLGRPVVVLDPKILPPPEMRKYYNLLEHPIQAAVRKAAKQLHATKSRMRNDRTRVLIILNDGYTALNMDEFQEVVGKAVRNDTSKIDYAVAGGMYYYSDRFDSYFFSKFDLIPVNVDKTFPSYGVLLDNWNKWVEKHMTSVVLGQKESDEDRLPVIDLHYEIDGIHYIKPCPPMGKPSSFWPNGKRPRENSTGIEHCPPIATCFPKLTKSNWAKFKETIPYDKSLQENYVKWIKWADEQERQGGTKLQPFVSVSIEYEECISRLKQVDGELSLAFLCRFATEVFETEVRIWGTELV